jgi:excisionase family DNA binding protein
MSREKSIRTTKVRGGEIQGTAPEIMNIHEAACYLGISEDSLYAYAAKGEIPAFKIGNRWRFRKRSLENWMDAMEVISPTRLI